ncbi:DUF2254 domain-containing protein [Salimicrobium flavidum]|uniref:Uncharacterized membrane protein n=1 Tax=Salimicrobium flavidum TaxID=570947 RepID=A0A1N7K1P0_9BACI|nr:DUF2254 domain-containing protein [Salimicrobium flavidum]SIS55510.1 Uncharacterized membrane protein [Salimicrobium flavidum]
MNTMQLWMKMRDSFWFLPTIYSLFALMAVTLANSLDNWLVPKITGDIPALFLVEKSTAQSLYGALVTSMLTMTTITFSTIMVVLTTYSTQFSPRTLQDFMKSRVTQHVLGVFSFGFVFTLINLLLLGKSGQKDFTGPFLTVLIAIICLGFFILFIHHSSRFLQVNNLIGKIRTDASVLIHNTFQEKNYTEAVEWNEEEIAQWKQYTPYAVKAKQSGYLQGVKIKGLLTFAKKHDLLLAAVFQSGDYIQKGAPIFYYWKREEASEEENIEACTGYILIGNERTDVQDIEFSIQKLVEIAVRAISPGINDPHTAVNCINRIGSLMSELAGVHQPFRYYADEDDNLRFMMEPKKFRDYLYKSFYQIRLYGKQDLTVMDAMLEALYKIAIVHHGHIKEETWNFAEYIMESTDIEEMHRLDYERFYDTCKKMADECGKELPIGNA